MYEAYAMELASRFCGGFAIRSGPDVYRFSGVLEPFDLDDLVQDTFLRAFEASVRTAYDGLRPFGRFLCAIARNLLVDRVRRDQRYAARLEVVQADEELQRLAHASDPRGPELAAADRELSAIYAGFVSSLEGVSRLVWRLRCEEQQTRRAVEERTGLSPMQVRSFETKLRRELFNRLQAAGYSFDPAALAALALWAGGNLP